MLKRAQTVSRVRPTCWAFDCCQFFTGESSGHLNSFTDAKLFCYRTSVSNRASEFQNLKRLFVCWSWIEWLFGTALLMTQRMQKRFCHIEEFARTPIKVTNEPLNGILRNTNFSNSIRYSQTESDRFNPCSVHKQQSAPENGVFKFNDTGPFEHLNVFMNAPSQLHCFCLWRLSNEDAAIKFNQFGKLFAFRRLDLLRV